MVEIAVSVAAKVAEYLVAPIVSPFRFIWNYKSNFEILETEVRKLKGKSDMIQHSVEDARRNGEEIEQHVADWLNRVSKIVDEASEAIEDNKKVSKQCFRGLCPNLKKRYQHGKKAANKVKIVVGLQEEGEFNKVSYCTIPEESWFPFVKDYKAFESRTNIVKDVLNALIKPDVNVVGVYGMGGIGKTTLVRKVERQAREAKLFDEVIFAEVSDSPNIEKIQGVIADQLGLKFNENSEFGRARRLCERLKKEDRVLVILDNIWGRLNLETIGVPFGDDHKGCKLLLTARSRDVLLNKMNSQQNFCISVLNDEDAWSLFKKIAGACIESHDLQSVAIDIAKTCGGLPLAIVTTAGALRNKGLYEWKNALRELRRPSSENFEGVAAEAYSSIQLSYNHLESEELKSTFLLCSAMEFTYNASVETLLRYGMGLGLFKRINLMEEARDCLDTLIQKLKDCSLLHCHDDRITMHDVVRDVARSIALRDQHVFTVTDGIMPRDWIDDDTLKYCTALSLHDIVEPPKQLEFPQLKFFYMRTKYPFEKLVDNFFIGLPKLRVLHLIGMDLLSLPTSLRLLIDLRALSLNECVIGNVAIIGCLNKLEILSFCDSVVEKLPEELRQLTMLRLLDLSNCLKLRVIPPNILSSLTQIEALYMGNSPIQWELEGLNINERSHASLDELKHLSYLTTLELHVPDANMTRGLFSQKLENYKICIGDNWDKWDWYRQYRTSKALKLKLDTHDCFEDGFFTQLKGIEDLCLDEMPGVRNILYELDRKGFPKLKHLEVQNNPNFLCIVDSMQAVSCVAFPILESLTLSNLINLEKICSSPLTTDSFCNLRIIRVESCDKLKTLFSVSIIKGLSLLEIIDVIECKNMEEVFTSESRDDINKKEVINNIQFSWLHSITLRSLPQLRSFCSEVKTSSSLQERQKPLTTDRSSQEINLEDELNITAWLFNGKVLFPNLKVLALSAINVEKIWRNQLPKISSCVQNLTRLTVQDCHNLKQFFSFSIVNSFVQLQFLEICRCPVLEELVVIEDSREERKDIIFPQLNWLSIEDLENLRRFDAGNCILFPSLEQLYIKKCPQLKAFIFNDKIAFPSLEVLRISEMDNLKMIWHDQLVEDSFCKLKSVDVRACPKLLTVFPSNMCGRFLRLDSLYVDGCSSLEEIFDLQGLNFEETHSIAATQLRTLDVRNLPKLKHIWNKDPQGLFFFERLHKMMIFKCASLTYILPASVAKSLLELEYFKVYDCTVKEIVAKENGEQEEIVRFVFPQMTTVKFCRLPELRAFYAGKHTVEGPVLKKLELYHCHKVKLFTEESLSFHENNELDQLDMPVEQPLFLVEKAFPSLEELGLSGKDITTVCQGQVREHLFRKLKFLMLNSDNSSEILSVDILQKFKNLETLELLGCSYKEVFYAEVGTFGGTFAQLKYLDLRALRNLKYVWTHKPDSEVKVILQNLESLELFNCPSLVDLTRASISFQNLTHLRVGKCHSLINLLTSSTAKSLVQLVKMKIHMCKMMTEVVANDGDTSEEEIIFRKLKSLLLHDLPSLTCFCSGDYNFKFPILEELSVDRCPKLQIFSQNVLSTRRFCIRQGLKGIGGSFGDEINTAIRKLHKDLNAQSSTEDCTGPSMQRLQ